MRMTGEQRIAAPRTRVWEALNDPEILRQSIPGCQALEKEDSEHFRATVEVKIGPIGARFNGAVTLSDIDAPNGYTISGEGQGGTVGFAKGGAKVRLAEEGGGTLLTYEVDADVGGRLAQLGGPIIDATAKRLAGQFFSRFGEVVGGAVPAAAVAGTQPVAAAAAATPSTAAAYVPAPRTSFPIAWVLAVIVAVLAGFLVARESDWLVLSVGLLVVVVAVAAFFSGRVASGGSR